MKNLQGKKKDWQKRIWASSGRLVQDTVQPYPIQCLIGSPGFSPPNKVRNKKINCSTFPLINYACCMSCYKRCYCCHLREKDGCSSRRWFWCWTVNPGCDSYWCSAIRWINLDMPISPFMLLRTWTAAAGLMRFLFFSPFTVKSPSQ